MDSTCLNLTLTLHAIFYRKPGLWGGWACFTCKKGFDSPRLCLDSHTSGNFHKNTGLWARWAYLACKKDECTSFMFVKIQDCRANRLMLLKKIIRFPLFRFEWHMPCNFHKKQVCRAGGLTSVSKNNYIHLLNV